MTTNFCDCGEILLFDIEWRRGQCAYCAMVDLEKQDRDFWDRWFDEGGK
jgi:hypothetical protein